MTVLILVIVVVLFFPSQALAWGIGVHIQLGSQILESLSRLPAALQPLLSAHPYDFLYGFISADITVGKKYTHYLRHCHSWRIGKEILAAARTHSQRACAYGYLGHLAADTVAHSFMVPFKMVRTFNTATLKHLYWEMRFESRVPPEIWQLARSIARRDFRANDSMMSGVLSRTLFSFSTNKRVFNSLLLLSRVQRWQKMLQSLGEQSKYTLDEGDMEDYLLLAREATESVLTHMENSPYWKADPAGERAMYVAGILRRNLNLLWLDGKLPEAESQRLLQQLKQGFRQGITNPESLLDLLAG